MRQRPLLSLVPPSTQHAPDPLHLPATPHIQALGFALSKVAYSTLICEQELKVMNALKLWFRTRASPSSDLNPSSISRLSASIISRTLSLSVCKRFWTSPLLSNAHHHLASIVGTHFHCLASDGRTLAFQRLPKQASFTLHDLCHLGSHILELIKK